MSFLRPIIALIAFSALAWADRIGCGERGICFDADSVRHQKEYVEENACLAFRCGEWTGVAFMRQETCMGALFLVGDGKAELLRRKLDALFPQLEWQGNKCRSPHVEGEVLADGTGIAVYALKIRKMGRAASPKKFLGMPIGNVYMRLATPISYEDGCLVWEFKHGYLRVPLKDGDVAYMEWKFKKDAPSKTEELIKRIAEATHVPLTKSEGAKSISEKDKVIARGKRTSEVLVSKQNVNWPFAVCMTDRKQSSGKELGKVVVFPEAQEPRPQSDLAKNDAKVATPSSRQDSSARQNGQAVAPPAKDHAALLRAFMESLNL